MTLEERLARAHAEAARLYLERQRIESHRHQVAQQAQLVDAALLKSDGAIELLESLIADEKASA